VIELIEEVFFDVKVVLLMIWKVELVKLLPQRAVVLFKGTREKDSPGRRSIIQMSFR
jgi:hypothetical protein